MERDFPNNYNIEAARILEALSLTKTKTLRVIGSSAVRPVLFAGDIDSNEIISGSTKKIAKGFQTVIKKLKKIPGVVIGDIKLGGTMENPKRWKANEIERGDGLVEAVEEPGLRKIDVIAPIAGRYTEITTVYQFKHELIGRDFAKELMEDLKEQLREKNYWKALKRWFSVLRLRKDKKAYDLLPIFNGDLGILYSVIADIKVLEYLLDENRGNKEVMKREINTFKDRLSHIWRTPEFMKKEPAFDAQLDKASHGDLSILYRLRDNFEAILQSEAKPLVKKLVGHL
jgi:hypothetical protein